MVTEIKLNQVMSKYSTLVLKEYKSMYYSMGKGDPPGIMQETKV